MTPYSWKIVTTANTSFAMPFECPPVAIWNDTVGLAKTATVEGIGTAVPNDDEMWVEVEYLGDASSPQASFVNDGKANLLATAAAQTASSATWGGGMASIAGWDAATITAVMLSGGNLVATNVGTTSVDQGARVASTSGNTSGKYYFEATFTTLTAGGDYGVGIGTPASSYLGMGQTGGVTGNMLFRSGNIYSAGTLQGGSSLAARSNGDVIGIAVDLDNRRVWFRVAPSGNWNNSGTANPATNTGGVVTPAGTMVPFCTFGGAGGTADNVLTANFGASTFTGAVPSGFTSGWPITPVASPAFKLSVPFTAAQKGWVYARVKCAKPSATFYIDPMLVLS